MVTYLRAEGLEHAIEVLADADDDLKILAGGQSLVPMMNLRLAQPSRLLDIGRIDELTGATVTDDVLRIGALVRHRELERPRPDIALAAPLLPEAAPRIGHVAIRECGTFGGSLAHGDPAAEWPACALALDATIVARSARGERRLPVDGFYVGPLTTILEPDELLVAVELPRAPRGSGVAVEELTYRHGDYAIVGVAVQMVATDDGGVADARIALFGVDATPVRAREAERILVAGGMAAIEEAARGGGGRVRTVLRRDRERGLSSTHGRGLHSSSGRDGLGQSPGDARGRSGCAIHARRERRPHRDGGRMTRTTGDRLPEPLVRILDGRDIADRVGFTIELLTIDDDGWPRVALLSVGEVLATDDRTLHLALWPATTSTSALARAGRGTLACVLPPTAYSVHVSARREADLRVGSMQHAHFRCHVEEVLSDTVGYAQLTSGVAFELKDADAVVARWTSTIDALRGAAADERS